MPEPRPQRLVLDTNVWLDLLVFEDPRCGPLLAVLREGRALAFSDAACREEWWRVLAYPAVGVAEVRRGELLRRYDGYCAVEAAARVAVGGGLPRCADGDDQKFLELAQAVGADVLLSRDRELLRLDGRVRRGAGFRVLTPEVWAAGG